MTTIITDEMVETAASACFDSLAAGYVGKIAMRTALEAVEPMIRTYYANLAREWINNNDPAFIEFMSEMNAIRAKGMQ